MCFFIKSSVTRLSVKSNYYINFKEVKKNCRGNFLDISPSTVMGYENICDFGYQELPKQPALYWFTYAPKGKRYKL